MKIMHFSSAKTWRGGENQIVLLIKGLKELRVENYLLCPKNSALHNRAKDLNIGLIWIGIDRRKCVGCKEALYIKPKLVIGNGQRFQKRKGKTNGFVRIK